MRDVPELIYRLLAEQAERERRSLAQQAVTVLARAKARQRALLEAIRSAPTAHAGKLSDPTKLIREDRRR